MRLCGVSSDFCYRSLDIFYKNLKTKKFDKKHLVEGFLHYFLPVTHNNTPNVPAKFQEFIATRFQKIDF